MNEEAVDILVKALGDKSEDIKVVAQDALVRIGRKTNLDLTEALRDERTKLRALRIYCGIKGTPEMVPAILESVSPDNEIDTRITALLALENIPCDLAMKALMALSKDDDIAIRRTAIEGLGRMLAAMP